MGSFSETLKKYREQNNVTKLALAKGIGTSDAYIRQIENQGYKPPTFDVCNKIAAFLSLSDNETETLFESAFIERIESEKDFYKMLKDTLFIKKRQPQKTENSPLSYTITWHLRKLLYKKLIPINDSVFQIIDTLASKHHLLISNIVISDQCVEFKLETNDPSSLQKNIPSLMKLASSKIKNQFQGFASVPTIWKNHFDISKNTSRTTALSNNAYDLSLTQA